MQHKEIKKITRPGAQSEEENTQSIRVPGGKNKDRRSNI